MPRDGALILPRRRLLRLAAPAIILSPRLVRAFEPHPLIPSLGPTLLAHAVASGSTTSVTTGAINTTGANFIIVQPFQWAGGTTPLMVMDSQSNTWTTGLHFQDAAVDSRINSSYVYTPSTSASHTFTVSGATIHGGLTVMAFSGVTSGTVQHFTSNWTTGSASSMTAGTGYTTSGKTLNIVGCAFLVGPSGQAITQGGVPVDAFNGNGNAGGNYGGMSGYILAPDGTVLDPTVSWTSGATQACVIIQAWPSL